MPSLAIAWTSSVVKGSKFIIISVHLISNVFAEQNQFPINSHCICVLWFDLEAYRETPFGSTGTQRGRWCWGEVVAHVPEVLLCQVDLLSELHFTECSEIFISLKALQRYEQTRIHRCHHCSFYRVMKFSQLQFVHINCCNRTMSIVVSSFSTSFYLWLSCQIQYFWETWW